MSPLTLSLSHSGGEGIETTPSPSERERAGVRVAQAFTHSPVLDHRVQRQRPKRRLRCSRNSTTEIDSTDTIAVTAKSSGALNASAVRCI
jgi:hypothetical protein